MLALVTALPLLLLPFYGLTGGAGSGSIAVAVGLIWVLTGHGHVVSTIWFAGDRDYQPVIRAHPMRMLGSLALIPAAMAALAIMSLTLSSWLYAGFLVWQAHHYNRQNYGILSFAAAHDKFGALPRELGWMINLTAAAGAIGMVTMPSIYPGGLPAPPFLGHGFAVLGHAAAIVLFLAAAALIVWVLLTNARLRSSPALVLFTLLSGAFFLPSLLPGPRWVTFWPYALAHGAQYLVFMAITSRRSAFGWVGFAAFAATAVVLGAVTFAVPGILWAQAYTGVIVWHFLADARLWRLRDPEVRAIVRRRFDFLFTAPKPAAALLLAE
jgi:hypothetical protein